jgi:methyl-accepting chemotaxis protein
VGKAKGGTEIVGRTKVDFEKVTAGSAKAAELVGEITAASPEQAQAIEQFTRDAGELDAVIQQIVATAEEFSAASEELNAQSLGILELTAVEGGAASALPPSLGCG